MTSAAPNLELVTTPKGSFLREAGIPLTEWDKAIEAVCRWHLDRAEECDSIAAANCYNPLGPDAETHAADHRLNAELIRAEFTRRPLTGTEKV